MDILSMIMSRNNGGEPLASIEPGKVFTYDGGEDADFVHGNGIRLVYLSDDVFDLSKIKKIKCHFTWTGQELEFGEDDFKVIDYYEAKAVQVSFDGQTAPVVFALEDGGLLGYAQDGFGYLSYVEFAETIHPIDPKYIPGAVLPVVELSTIPTVEGAQLTEMEVAAIKATEGMPFIGKFQFDIADTGTPIPFSVIFTGIIVGERVMFEAYSYVGLRLMFNIGDPSNSVENAFSYRQVAL